MELIKFIFSNFWIWAGTMIFLSGLGRLLFLFYNRTLRAINIRKRGYPPAHCDADGDFIETNEESEDDE